MTKVTINGLTGYISFENKQRKDFEVDVLQLKETGLFKVSACYQAAIFDVGQWFKMFSRFQLLVRHVVTQATAQFHFLRRDVRRRRSVVQEELVSSGHFGGKFKLLIDSSPLILSSQPRFGRQ